MLPLVISIRKSGLFVLLPQHFEGQPFCTSLLFFSLMQQSIVMVNMCISFFFSRLRLSVGVQRADTVSFQAVAPPFGSAFKQLALCLAYFVFQ